MMKKIANMQEAGVQIIVLLALNDESAPYYDKDIAKKLQQIGISSFACTPDLFPDLMAITINKGNMKEWAGKNDIVLKH
jgi:hypothetical protein